MEIELDFTKSAQENADEYYKKAKKLVLKRQGAERAVRDLEERLEKSSMLVAEAPRVITLKKREWYEKFHWFFTSDGMLAIGGRDAKQNELVNSRYFEDSDLFFHADIFGADLVVLKDGAGSGRQPRVEAAQFAACHSSAWKQGLRTIDVYAMRREQVSKSSAKGSLGTGSFLLSGEREWYRDNVLSLVMYVSDGRLFTVPESTFERESERLGSVAHVRVTQGNFRKSDAAKRIAQRLGYGDIDEIMRHLPADGFRMA